MCVSRFQIRRLESMLVVWQRSRLWCNLLRKHCMSLCFAVVFVVRDMKPVIGFARGRRFNLSSGLAASSVKDILGDRWLGSLVAFV